VARRTPGAAPLPQLTATSPPRDGRPAQTRTIVRDRHGSIEGRFERGRAVTIPGYAPSAGSGGHAPPV